MQMNKILAAWAWNGPVSEPIRLWRRTYQPDVCHHRNIGATGKNAIFCKKSILIHSKTRTGLMENICGVTDFLREKAKQRGADPERATLHVVR